MWHTYVALGDSLTEGVGEPVEAFREYKRVLTIAPDHPEARQALARMGTR